MVACFIGGETIVHRENHRPVTSHWQTLSHNVISSTPLGLAVSGIQTHTTLVVIGTDCTGNSKSNYHMITIMNPSLLYLFHSLTTAAYLNQVIHIITKKNFENMKVQSNPTSQFNDVYTVKSAHVVTSIKQSPFSCPVVEHFIWIEPL
jgi:hypothetical protein